MKFLVYFSDSNIFYQLEKYWITRGLLDQIRNGEARLLCINDDGDFEEFHPSDLKFSSIEVYDFADHEEEERQEIWAMLVGKMIPASVPGTFISSP